MAEQQSLLKERKDGLLEYCGPVDKEEDRWTAAEAWAALDDDKEDDIWAQAAIAAAIVPTYGKRTMEEFAEKVELGVCYIRRMAKTFKHYTEKDTRVPNLRFNLHALSLRHKPDPKEALLVAGENGWGRVKLEEWIINTAYERGTGKPKKPPAFSELDKSERTVYLKALRERISEEQKQCPYKEYEGMFTDFIESVDWDIYQLGFEVAQHRVEQAIIEGGHRTQKQIEKNTHLSPLEVTRVIGRLVGDEGEYEWREQRGETRQARGSHTMMLYKKSEPHGSACNIPQASNHYTN